jgi:hypothetical protein
MKTSDTISKPPTPAKPKPTAQTVLKALGFATYSAYFLHRQKTRHATEHTTKKPL